MAENQNVEWKESWRDEYIKWICGFANAQGGTIYIGKNDSGVSVGVKDSKKLLEDIPNKVRNFLGLVVDVNLHTDDGNDYIEIIVKPSNIPVSYKGEYHYRSGSTKQQLTGASLTQFLLDKTGIRWESVPVNNVSVSDLRNDSFDIFREQALLRKRMDADDINMSNEDLLNHLDLLSSDGKLTRAAVLLFHHNPEKWITGAYIKIGYFETDDDLRYQDEIHGSLISQADRIVDLIFTKYLKADISYNGDTRVETYPYPREAIREAVYNSIVHKSYSAYIPIQISVYSDKLYIGNDCVFPEGWTVSDLMGKHRSRPLNQNIANVFFRAGYIEAWGRGIEKICNACAEYGIPLPEYNVKSSEIMVLFRGLLNKQSEEDNSKPPQAATSRHKPPLAATDKSVYDIFALIEENPKITQAELVKELGISMRTIQRVVRSMVERGLIRRVGTNRYGEWEIIKKEE